ncbi:MAG: MATE family efflux transporter [Pseudomonadota bacterium]
MDNPSNAERRELAPDPAAAGSAEPPLTTRTVLVIALPVVLSNAAVPLQGAVDTAIMGNTGDTVLLAAVALGAAAIALVLSSFNFLDMGIGGLTAQAIGAGQPGRAVRTLLRGLAIALVIGLVLVVLRTPLVALATALFAASDAAETAAGTYIRLRLLGAPVELMTYALMGWFAGQGRTGVLFRLQLAVSFINVAATLALVLGLDLGIRGVALGTVIAQVCGLVYGLVAAHRVARRLLPEAEDLTLARVFRGPELAQLLTLNRDIFLRTVLISAAFAWFARLGSMQGDLMMAVNGVLIEFFFVTTAALDGFAIAAESLVGRAIGRRSPGAMRRAVRVVAWSGAVLAVGLSGLLALSSGALIALFTDVAAVRETAADYALWAALIPMVGVAAFMLDGIFVGAAEGRAMRDTMAISAGLFIPLGWVATVSVGNHGTWAAIWGFLILRAVTLALHYPRLEARVAASTPTASATLA